MAEPPDAEAPDGDPFDGLQLDEDFVRGGHRESSADERAAQAAWRAQAEAAAARRRRAERRARSPIRRASRWLRDWRRTSPLVVLCLFLGLVAWNSGRDGATANTGWLGGPTFVLGVGTDRPPLQRAESDSPLGVVPFVDGSGPHTFMQLQPGSTDPVTYDPCRPIHVVINDRTAPPGTEVLVEEAIAQVAQATGLRFVIEGATDEVPSMDRDLYQPDRYGDRWAPVLVAWSDPDELPGLRGDVAGLGGSGAVGLDGGTMTYVSGQAALDGPQLERMMGLPGGMSAARAVILHELAHVVGLGHVDSPTQLMHDEGHPGIDSFQLGDREGLARLGDGECRREL